MPLPAGHSLAAAASVAAELPKSSAAELSASLDLQGQEAVVLQAASLALLLLASEAQPVLVQLLMLICRCERTGCSQYLRLKYPALQWEKEQMCSEVAELPVLLGDRKEQSKDCTEWQYSR
jgi:hypothetical protein